MGRSAARRRRTLELRSTGNSARRSESTRAALCAAENASGEGRLAAELARCGVIAAQLCKFGPLGCAEALLVERMFLLAYNITNWEEASGERKAHLVVTREMREESRRRA